MPTGTDNLTDPPGDPGADAEWARWEQTFRDARPVLPEVAMQRIEAAMVRAAGRSTPPRRNGRWVVLLILVLGLCGFALLSFWLRQRLHVGGVGSPSTAPALTDPSNVPPPPGPQLEVPDQPVLPPDDKRALVEPQKTSERK
jgi:hypothetical protein